MSKNYKIAVLPGDGTGPEVIAEAVKVLDAAGKKFGFTTEKEYYNWGGAHYLATGEPLPADAKEQLARHDAVLLGAIRSRLNGGLRGCLFALFGFTGIYDSHDLSHRPNEKYQYCDTQERDNETYKRIEKAFGNGNSLNDLIGALCE